MTPLLLLLIACAGGVPPATEGPPPTGAKADDGEPVVAGLLEGSLEAEAVLAVAEALDRDALDLDVGLTSNAADAIAEARPFASMQALLDVDGVGPVSVRRLFLYADLEGWLDYGSAPETPSRVVAIGDLHGDIDATREVLRLAGAIDEHDRWVGSDLVVVQVGDILDRGDGEAEIVRLFTELEAQAREDGGALVMLLGNHELMNGAGDFRYVTEPGLSGFGDAPDGAFEGFDENERARAAAFLPGGRVARWLARHDVVAHVGDTLFAHAGILPDHVDYGLSLLNHEARAFLIFEGLDMPPLLDAEDGPVWYRGYGSDDETDCELVAEALEAAGASRMVVGHSVQDEGITSACDETLFRIDVGMSAYYGGPIEALEIVGDDAWVLSF